MTDLLSIVPLGVFAPSAVTGAITSGPLGASGPQTAAGAVVMPQTDVSNGRAQGALFTLVTQLFDASGALVAAVNTSASLPPGGTTRLFQELALPSASLWNVAPAPPLYTLVSTLWVGGAPVDDVVTTIGIRNAVWSPNEGFMLNGLPVPVQGFSNHQSFAGCGNALPDRIDDFRISALRGLGANMWRGSYPTSTPLLDAADARGMLVWEENRFLSYQVLPQPPPSRRRGRRRADGGLVADPPPLPPDVAIADPQLLQDAQDMALRDRNHPSIVVYR